MRVISKSNASSLEFAGQTYEPGADGVFDFPEPVGLELTTKHASMWVSEAVHLAAVSAAEVERLRNPNVLPGVIADLLRRVAALEATAAPAKPKAPKAETAPPPPPATSAAGSKAADARKPSTAKKTTAKKVAATKPEQPADEPAATTSETPADEQPGDAAAS